ncbi:MAG TPA: response regulator [Pirellulales bacterium]|jgi:two-component system alkaline phosphatase synthesis response regulator PhoP|nr:response regulator [Pirellulales bacterium]
MPKIVHLCDDENHILRTAELRLRLSGFDVRLSRDGESAWQAILQSPPDLLITDLQMPGVDGLELVRRIRANPDLQDLPIVMLTGKGFEISAEEMAQQWGVSAVVGKPFSPRELAKLAEQCVAASAAV